MSAVITQEELKTFVRKLISTTKKHRQIVGDSAIIGFRDIQVTMIKNEDGKPAFEMLTFTYAGEEFIIDNEDNFMMISEEEYFFIDDQNLRSNISDYIRLRSSLIDLSQN